MSLLKSNKIVLATIIVFSIFGLVWFAVAHRAATRSVDVTWPTKPKTHTLQLRPASSKESTRLVDFAPNQQTIAGMRIEYRDGRTALVAYQDGQPTMISTYFAEPVDSASKAANKAKAIGSFKHLSDGLDSRQLQSVITLKGDGKTIKSMTTYSPDGHCASVGLRNGADDFAVTVYGDGPTAFASIALFNGKDGSLKFEQDFRADGTLASSFSSKDLGDPRATQTFFDAAGVKTKEILFDAENDVTINEFASDGKTIAAKTGFGYHGLSLTSYDPASSNLVAERTYADDNNIQVVYFGSNGNATMEQYWVKLDTTAVPANQIGVVNDGFVLSQVNEYHNDGRSLKVAVTFFPGGKVVQEYLTRPTTETRPSTDQHFRKDGSLDLSENCPSGHGVWGECTTTKMPEGANKIRAAVPARYFQVIPLLPAPTIERPTIPKMTMILDLR